MSKIRNFTVLVLVLSAANAWGAGFFDDFNRLDGDVGNGWSTQADGTIEVKIVSNEVLIAGTQGTDWVRSGIYRNVENETRVSCDFRANEGLNFHIRIDDADTSAFIDVYTWGGPMIHANSEDGGWPGWTDIAGSNIISGEYNNVVLELIDGNIVITLNDTEIAALPNANFTSIGYVLIASDTAAGSEGSLHIDNVQIGIVLAQTAKGPSPDDGATNVPQDVILSWEPGSGAAAHDVYFGESFDDVNAAPTMNTLDVLVSNDQTGTTYDHDGLLDFGKTYYWRIDEINAPPDSSVFRGDVWSFTVEPFAYQMTGVTATASSENTADMGPGKTVDGSGLAGDLHSTEPTDMWLSSVIGEQPTWIQYEFDKVYGLYEMWIWNSNQLLEPVIGFGVKNVTIEVSEDGENWTSIGDFEIPRAAGQANGTNDATIDLAGVTAKFVRLTVNSGWGGIVSQFGLSEVRFFYVPVQANDPTPADAASDVELDVTLRWRSGREVAAHEVYFSSDRTAVEDGTAPAVTVAEGNYTPGTLEYGQIYYWKVNEVNDAAAVPVREGDVWEFSTVETLIVDDFESYTDNDLENEAIWQTWIDGFGVTENGSQVGYLVPPYAEQSIVSSGRQSMPFMYGGAAYSQAERTFAQAQDWTTGGVTQLSVWFRGYPGSSGSFVEGPAGTYTMTGSGADIWDNADEFHFAYKTLTGPGTIIARVESIEETDVWAKAGVMIRETLDPGSAHAFACVTPQSGVASQGRIDTGSSSFNTAEAGITAPHWVKLERDISGTFTVSHSSNGTSWAPVAGSNPTNIQMASTVYIGLAVTSHDVALTAQAVFSNVSTTGNVTGQWVSQDIGIATNAAEPLYIGVADSAGNSATITHEDPAATQIDTWTEWSVDLADLANQGVNIASVKKLILGVGDPTGTVPGGSGTLYFDDIAVGNPVQTPAN
ncbi:MAG: discoidin domain-containing protein [Planctomycetota bacterium]